MFRKVFYLLCRMGDFCILIKNPWHPRWEIGVMGKFYYSTYHSCPSGMVKIQ